MQLFHGSEYAVPAVREGGVVDRASTYISAPTAARRTKAHPEVIVLHWFRVEGCFSRIPARKCRGMRSAAVNCTC